MDAPEVFLEHYGIKGMKWGVRRSDAELARARGKEPPSADAKSAAEKLAKARSSGSEALSNEDLKELNKRLNLESNYERLTFEKAEATRIEQGEAFVQSALKAGKTMNEIIAFAKSDAGKAISKSILKATAKAGAKTAAVLAI